MQYEEKKKPVNGNNLKQQIILKDDYAQILKSLK